MESKRARLLARLSFAFAAFTAVPVATLTLPIEASAQPVVSDENRCRQDLANGSRRYVEQVLRARIKCQNRIVIGEIPPGTDCVTGSDDDKLDRMLRRAEDKLSNVGAQCGGVNLTALGFPGVCPDPDGGTFDTQDFKECVVDETDELVAMLLDYYYPPLTDFFRGSPAKCLKGSAVDAMMSLSRSVRARERCLIDQELHLVRDEVDCREEILPYGPGTGEERVDLEISHAYIKLLGAIPTACVDVNIDDLEYQSSCDDPTGGLFTIFDLKDCFFDVNRLGVTRVLGIAFPTDPFCGDGNVNAGEECDDGTANSNNPNACRPNCKNPKCGDSIKDDAAPFNEECDDGDSDNTDGCTTQCQTEVVIGCGNGVEEPSNNEECDDGNKNNNDGCSSLCLDEYCGDGIIQPPREQCDDGEGVDGNANEPDKCRATGEHACRNPRCGDGITDSGEDCDDNNTSSGDGCPGDCIVTVCGDGTKEGTEFCDLDTDCPAGQACNEGCTACEQACPIRGELTLWAGVGGICTTNGDCEVGSCEEGRCRTVTRLDSGWTGLAHNADINDGLRTRGKLACPGHGPTCGECNVTGIDTSLDSCRCSNDNRRICDAEFTEDSSQCPACVNAGQLTGLGCSTNTNCLDNLQKCTTDQKVCTNNNNLICVRNSDCASPGTCTATRKACSVTKTKFCANDGECVFNGTCTGVADCNCYFGTAFPLSSAGTPACILNRFSQNISGQANVDLGAGSITAKLRTLVYLGVSTTNPCPTCGGKCSNDATKLCDRDEECTGGTCLLDDVMGDGVRNGVCRNAGSPTTLGAEGFGQNGLPCDATAYNASFPAYPTGESGGYYSLDCRPFSPNVSGAGLVINLTQTTGTTTLAAEQRCQPTNPDIPDLCPCLQCTTDQSQACNTNADCEAQGGACALSSVTQPKLCSTNAECASVDVGPCNAGRCFGRFALTCTNNNDCSSANLGSCNPSTCTSKGSGNAPVPNECTEGLCSDVGDGVGLCTIGPDESFCDGIVKANGTGILSCADDESCSPAAVGDDAGKCTLSFRRSCFHDPIIATGDPDPKAPVGAAAFCIPPTSSTAINGVAGLPGPGRVVNQATSRTFCDENFTIPYEPGSGCQ